MASGVDKLKPNDPRVQLKTTTLGGRTWGYYLGEPEGPKRATIFLIHGFPDLSFGWRYQVPMLLKLGLRVVVPDMMGYGRTDAPPYTLKAYGYKQVSDAVKELADQLGERHIVALGHDWGGAVVYRIALHHPELVTHVISVCTPYALPNPTFVPLGQLVHGPLKTFGYQLQFMSGDVEEAIPPTADGVRKFLSSLHAGYKKSGTPVFSPKTGVRLHDLNDVAEPPFMTPEELEHYVSEYTRPRPPSHFATHPLHGPLNWYRTRELNYLNSDLPLIKDGKPVNFPCPVLYIGATNETVLTTDMAAKMGSMINDLTVKEVETGHWALTEDPAGVNAHLKGFLEGRVLNKESRL